MMREPLWDSIGGGGWGCVGVESNRLHLWLGM